MVSALPQLDSIVIDESFIDFSDLTSADRLAVESRNLVVVKSLGESMGLHGIRLGYAVANRHRAEQLRKWIG